MERFIKTYPKRLLKSECDGIIEWFELMDEQKKITQTTLSGHRKFSEVNLNNFRDITLNLQLKIYEILDATFEEYKRDVNIHQKVFPDNSVWEELRIKRYGTNTDNFLDHVDVGNYDSARRFLVFFIYLNDVDFGGETEFPELNLTISPECGRILVFPATWTYLHRGNTPISNDKYILGSYKHYV